MHGGHSHRIFTGHHRIFDAPNHLHRTAALTIASMPGRESVRGDRECRHTIGLNGCSVGALPHLGIQVN